MLRWNTKCETSLHLFTCIKITTHETSRQIWWYYEASINAFLQCINIFKPFKSFITPNKLSENKPLYKNRCAAAVRVTGLYDNQMSEMNVQEGVIKTVMIVFGKWWGDRVLHTLFCRALPHPPIHLLNARIFLSYVSAVKNPRR